MPIDAQHLQQFSGMLIPAALIAFFMYRRFRRNFGKQLLRRGQMIFRLLLLSVIGVLLLPATLHSVELALVTGAGLVVGTGLGVWAAKHLRFENHDGKLYYIPHTYAGLIVTALFFGRIVNRVITVAPVIMSSTRSSSYTPTNGDLDSLRAYTHNPVTRGILFILIGYYVYYYAYVLWESKHLKPGDFEDQSASPPKS